MCEEWRDIQGHVGFYQVSTDGEIKRLAVSIKAYTGNNKAERILSQTVSSSGYYSVMLSSNGSYKRLYVHRIIASAFIPNPLSKAEINHKDGNKLNNKLDNLEWVTPGENMQHAYNTGLMPRSHLLRMSELSKRASRKLSEIAATNARKAVAEGSTIASTARRYGVSETTIRNIVQKRTYIELMEGV